MIFLSRTNPSENLYRWYAIGIQSTLLDESAVVCGWGRLGGHYQRWRIIPIASEQEADRAAAVLLRHKLQHGYQLLEDLPPLEKTPLSREACYNSNCAYK